MISAYLSRLTLAGYRPRTINARQTCLLAVEESVLPRPLLEATRYDLEAFLARPLAPESRRAYRSHLRGYYLWAIEEGLIRDDPTLRLPPIRIPRAIPRPVSPDDLAHAVTCSRGRMRAWLLLMALGGLRCIEVAHLRPSDVLHGTEQEGTVLFLRECKGGGSGVVPAHPAILDELANLPVRNGLWWALGPPVVSRQVSAYLRSVGVDATAHQLRHSAGTAWLKASGHDLLTTSRLLRHATVQSSQIYTQLDPTRPAQVVALTGIGV